MVIVDLLGLRSLRGRR